MFGEAGYRFRFGGFRALSEINETGDASLATGLGKITAVDAVGRACQVIIESEGPGAFDGPWGELLVEMPAWRAGGGTFEILRNVVGERVLGLPKGAS